MRVLILATGKTEEHNDSYGARLVEQGKAVPTPPVAEEVGAGFPQRSKNRREGESPNGFSGTARRDAVPAPPGTARRENVTTPTVTALAGDCAAPPPPEGEARPALPVAKKGRAGRSGKE